MAAVTQKPRTMETFRQEMQKRRQARREKGGRQHHLSVEKLLGMRKALISQFEKSTSGTERQLALMNLSYVDKELESRFGGVDPLIEPPAYMQQKAPEAAA